MVQGEVAAGGGGDWEVAGGAEADDPERDAVAAEQQRAFLVAGGEAAVGEDVADEFRAAIHAEGLEAVALPPGAYGEHGVAVEGGGVEIEDAVVAGDGGEVGDGVLGDDNMYGREDVAGKRDHGLVGARGPGRRRLEDERAAVEPRLVVGRGIILPGGGGGEGAHDRAGGVDAETVPADDLEDQGRGRPAKVQAEVTDNGRAVDAERAVVARGEVVADKPGDGDVGQGVGRGDIARGADDGIHGAGEIALEAGKDAQPQGVAPEGVGGVGTVIDPTDIAGAEVLLDLAAGDLEQGADDVVAARPDAGEARRACAAQEVEKQGLGVVLAVVAYGHGACAVTVEEFEEPFVAQRAAGHLERLAGGGHTGGDVEVADVDVDVEPVGDVARLAGVAAALLATEAEVAVGGDKPVAQGREDHGEGRRIGAPAEPHDKKVVGPRKVVVLDEAEHAPLEILYDVKFRHEVRWRDYLAWTSRRSGRRMGIILSA